MRKSTAKFLDRRVFYDGNVIFAQGAPGDVMYLIESGTVRLTQMTDDDEEIETATISGHGIFGEMALIDGRRRMAETCRERIIAAMAG